MITMQWYIYAITWFIFSLWRKQIYMSYDLPQTQHNWLLRDAYLSKAAKGLFGLAYRDKLKQAGTFLTPFWTWPKIQQTIASQW